MSPSAVAMLFGVAGSVLFHLSKGLQRHGIGALDSFLPKRRRKTRGEAAPPGTAKNVALYTAGFILNNSLGFFAILANRYGPSSYYTSMFGTGLLALMIYSGFILKEPLHILQYAGALVLTLGTVLLGLDGIRRPEMTMAGVDLPVAGLLLAASFVAGAGLLVYVRGKKEPGVLGVVYGILIGFAACLDPVLKGIGQNLGGDGRFLPLRPLGWAIFLASFVFATLSFATSQWAFRRGIRASVLIPSQTFAYIAYPVLFQALALPAFRFTGLAAWGLGITVLGLVVMQTAAKSR